MHQGAVEFSMFILVSGQILSLDGLRNLTPTENVPGVEGPHEESTTGNSKGIGQAMRRWCEGLKRPAIHSDRPL